MILEFALRTSRALALEENPSVYTRLVIRFCRVLYPFSYSSRFDFHTFNYITVLIWSLKFHNHSSPNVTFELPSLRGRLQALVGRSFKFNNDGTVTTELPDIVLVEHLNGKRLLTQILTEKDVIILPRKSRTVMTLRLHVFALDA